MSHSSMVNVVCHIYLNRYTIGDYMNVTVFGTCRLDSLGHYNNRIKHEISYTYDTKEILEVIKFIKHNHVSPEDTITTFRTPMLTKQPIYAHQFEGVLDSDIFIIEICGKKTYMYNQFHVHSALADYSNETIASQIVIREQSDEEIEQDILTILHELHHNIILVGHIVTDEFSERYKLSRLLEHICQKHHLWFINPVEEMKKQGYDIRDAVVHEPKIYHYNETGHRIMKEIYEKYIHEVRQYIQKYS
jgi:hypothetical protein